MNIADAFSPDGYERLSTPDARLKLEVVTFIVDAIPQDDDYGLNLAGFSQALMNTAHCKDLTLVFINQV